MRSQGGCGSCWAFATVSALEWNIGIRDGVVVDLSEQWLVSCNQEVDPPQTLEKTWGCNGGWWAHDYFTGAATDPCGGSGAVFEADFPYIGSVTCHCPYPHGYAMDSWAYIGAEDEIPTVDAIKQAIMEYGPVCAAVYVGDAFRAYDGGVFNVNETGDEVNHAVLLVGWDDTQGAAGVWILRNSWMNTWGEGGYMRIEYGCSMIGYGACYVDYAGAHAGIPPVILSQPRGGAIARGWNHLFLVEADGVGGLHYQWMHDGVVVGEDAPRLAIAHAQPDDAGLYTCIVTDGRGQATTEAAELVIDPMRTLPGAGLAALAAGAGLILGLLHIKRYL